MYLIIDDLNFYANKDSIRQLEAAGGMVIRNNPFRRFYMHLLSFKVSRIFQRNHQKVMLVDDNIFCGSLNIANMYSSVRYGDGSFRDLNIILKRHPSKKVRDFFRKMIIRNAMFYPHMIREQEINQIFDNIDDLYKQEHEKFYLEQKAKHPEVGVFLQETPPEQTEVS